MAAKNETVSHYRSILKEVQSGNPASVYMLYGEESFFLDRLQKAIIDLVPPELRDFNLDLLYGSESSPAEVLERARSYPMMAERRVVVVREFRSLLQNVVGDEQADLIPYLERPNPQTVLLLIDEKGPDARTKLGKALKDGKTVQMAGFEELDPVQLPDWIEASLHEVNGKRMEPDGVRLLIDLVGSSLQLLSTELDKVCSFVDSREVITREDVERVIGSYRQLTVIELKESILSRQYERSMKVVERMLQHTGVDTGEMLRTVGFFYSVFGNIWQIVRLQEKGFAPDQIQEAMGIKSSWFMRRLIQDASAYRLADMPRIFEALLDADRALKGFGTLPPDTILILMVRRILGD